MLLKKTLSLLKLKCQNCREWKALGLCSNRECQFFKQNSLPFGWYLCKQNFDIELTDGAYGSFLEGKQYYLEVIDNGYFIRDDFQQLIKMPKEMFKENFTKIT
ncbi:MAG: hypothetical protein ACLSX0_01495 [Anaerostipes caccae]|jgi:hypothetical protein